MRTLTATHTIDCPLCWSEHVEGLRSWEEVSILDVGVKISPGTRGSWEYPPALPEIEDVYIKGGSNTCGHDSPEFDEAVYETIVEAFNNGDIVLDDPSWANL